MRSQIESRIPHAGAMCLLDSVQRWDNQSITCEAPAPTAAHPLAGERGVGAVVAVEYAAQAAAVHGSLLDDRGTPRQGRLAKLSDVELTGALLDQAGGPLTVHAQVLGRTESGCLYSFEVSQRHGCVARGRLLVAFPP